MNDVFTSHQAVELAGITYPMLDRWASKGYIHPIEERAPEGRPSRSPGSGHYRFWSRDEIEVIERAGRLVRAGLSPDRAVAVARTPDELIEVAPGVSVIVTSLQDRQEDAA